MKTPSVRQRSFCLGVIASLEPVAWDDGIGAPPRRFAQFFVKHSRWPVCRLPPTLRRSTCSRRGLKLEIVSPDSIRTSRATVQHTRGIWRAYVSGNAGTENRG